MKTTKIKSLDGKELTFLAPTKAELASLAWRPIDAGYPVPFTGESGDIINQMTRGSVIKGGEGSGNHRHKGRPGERGGSAPGDGKDYPRKIELKGGRVELEGDLNLLIDYRLTPDDLAEILDLGIDGSTASVYVKYSEKYDALKVMGTWADSEGRTIGEFNRLLFANRDEVKLNILSFEKGYMGKGLGTRAANQWFQKLADKGYETALMLADLEVGRYAWAKEGAQYDDGDGGYTKARDVTRKFKQWADKHNISAFDDGDYPTFENPQDVANYKHPSGYKLSGKDIFNPEVPVNMQMDLGKAFMLDQDPSGHGSWDAVINLKNWKGRGHAYKAITVDDLIGGDEKAHYVDVGKDIPGGSDALFWSQYLEEDEGEPMFGFAQVSTNKRSDIIKGGPGSGNHGHAGIPGQQGGSKPTGRDSVEGSTNQPLVDGMTNPKGRTFASIRAQAGAGEKVSADDPLLSVIHGNDNWKQAPHSREIPVNYYVPKDNHEKVLKNSVVEQLASDLGIEYGMANEFIHDWAMSSNDSRMQSLIHQKLAAAHFGTKLTNWQQVQLKQAKDGRNKFINDYIDEMFGWDDSPVLANVTLDHLERKMSEQLGGFDGSMFYPFESDLMQQMVKGKDLGWLKNKAEVKSLLRKIERESEALTKKAIKSIYKRTQEKLAAAGITELLLHRGAILKHSQLGSPGDMPSIQMNALSSWSASEYTAEQGFAYQGEWDYKEGGTTGFVFSAVVPANRIYSMPSTGQGCLFEWEMVVIGSKDPEPAFIKTTYKDKRKTVSTQ